MTATIRTVAQHAGVSVATVSHALNRTRHVSPALQQRVEAAARELGYVPSAIARSLKSRQTQTLGMMTPNSSNPYFAEIVREVEDWCFGAGYHLVLCNSNDEPRRQSIYLDVLSRGRIAGLVLLPAGDDGQLITQLRDLRMPVVLLDRRLQLNGLSVDGVHHDNVLGARLATEHLLALGHRRIACIGASAELPISQDRVDGWRQALHGAGLAVDDALLGFGGFSFQGGFDAMRALLALPQRPSAVFACNDLMAVGALGAIEQAGLCVPGDVSVVGFDDIDLARYVWPPLTTVAQPKQQMSRMAVDMLFERIDGRRTEPRSVTLAPRLALRSSTAACAGATSVTLPQAAANAVAPP